MQDFDFIKSQSKEKRLEYYFKCLSMNQWINRESLNLTGADVRNYQRMKEQEVSMKPGEKRKLVVKNVVKKLLKNDGFKNKGNEWWKELEDCWLLIYMKTSRFNSPSTGSNFGFEISVSGKDEIADKIENQWIYNQLCSLNSFVFLPYCGFLAPNRSGITYKIDGYRNFLPLDTPIEEILAQIQTDFQDCILPELDKVKKKADWEILYKEKCARYDEKEIRLLRYYSSAHVMSCSEENIPGLIRMQKELALTTEDILSHFDWLSIIAQNSQHTYLNAKPFIMKSLNCSDTFCRENHDENLKPEA